MNKPDGSVGLSQRGRLIIITMTKSLNLIETKKIITMLFHSKSYGSKNAINICITELCERQSDHSLTSELRVTKSVRTAIHKNLQVTNSIINTL